MLAAAVLAEPLLVLADQAAAVLAQQMPMRQRGQQIAAAVVAAARGQPVLSLAEMVVLA
jgi:hypothetical protein